MAEMNYDEMLDNLYEKLPKNKTVGERFEIPVFVSFAQGKQTVLKNLKECAEKIRRDPDHIVRYIIKDLGTTGSYDGKQGILQGKFRDDLLKSRFLNYVKEFVLCNECKKPDTELIKFEGVEH
ncbi:MAG: translation initiation factor IF-2 subunit beta, partial [Candidatus Micrarchaeota archaeon]